MILSGGLGKGEWVIFNKSFSFIASGLLGLDRTRRKGDITCRNVSLPSGVKVLHNDFMPNRNHKEQSLIYIEWSETCDIALTNLHTCYNVSIIRYKLVWYINSPGRI